MTFTIVQVLAHGLCLLWLWRVIAGRSGVDERLDAGESLGELVDLAVEDADALGDSILQPGEPMPDQPEARAHDPYAEP